MDYIARLGSVLAYLSPTMFITIFLIYFIVLTCGQQNFQFRLAGHREIKITDLWSDFDPNLDRHRHIRLKCRIKSVTFFRDNQNYLNSLNTVTK